MTAVDRMGGHAWAIVLAGGDGARMRGLTADCAGGIVPKQFCTLNGGASLIARTLHRAESVVGRERVAVIVSDTHARYWRPSLAALPADNVVVQPLNRGTGIGILLPALRIVERDPNATILILPSDHYVADEHALGGAMETALSEIADHASGVALLGIRANEADPELGYIVPARTRGALLGVRRFVEKPPLDEAIALCRQGALWNSFIIACRARSLIELYRARSADVLCRLGAIDLTDYAAIVRCYAELPSLDFSRDVAIGQERRLSVMPVPSCGWSDLGTPRRLAQTLARCGDTAATCHATESSELVVNLAERLKLADLQLPEHPNLTIA